VTLILITLLRRVPGRHATVLGGYSFAIAAALLLGALVEVLQFVTGRDASFDVFLRDALGALAATGFFAVLDPREFYLVRIWLE
jgi:VanZ family protein